MKTSTTEMENGNIPLAAFTGALVASATLLLPDGLIPTFFFFSLTTPISIAVVSLGRLAVFMGAGDTADDQIKWRETDLCESKFRDEREWMDLWNNEIYATEK